MTAQSVVMWKHLMASLCMGKKKIPFIDNNISAFETILPDNDGRSFCNIHYFSSKIINTINFNNAREQRGENGRLDYSFSWRFFFFLILYFLCFFQGNGNNFLLSLSLRPFSLSRRWNVKPLFWGVFCCFFFYSYRSVRCWKPFDPQSRVLLTDWCFHTVTLAELPVFGGPRCHSGTNALEFSQIIPLCTCLCGTMVNRNGKHLSLYLSVSLRGLAFN